MRDRPQDVVLRPLVTEKNLGLVGRTNAYSFEVAGWANKVEIRRAVEHLFTVKVSAVRTQNRPGKRRRMGWRRGRTPDWKKAIVTLKQGYAIEFY